MEKPIPELKPIPDIQPIQTPEDARAIEDESAGKPEQVSKKTAKKHTPALGLEEPDYTGMSIAERIRARAEWNRRKAAKAR